MHRRHRKISILLTALLAMGLVGPASAQFGRNKIQYRTYEWQVLNTPHFNIIFYAGEEELAYRTGLIMEDGYRMLSQKLGQGLPWKVPVVLYGSHNDFQQTNVSLGLLPEGVQAFAEPSRKRIVLPFNGSYKMFSHTAIHELAHVFTFNIIYNRLLDSVFSRNYLFNLPLWLMEGLAEYLSIGWDPESDMYIRDAVIYDYLVELDLASGFYVYKEGQSVWNYIEDTYGREKVLDILDVLSTTRNADAALEKTIGLDSKQLSEQWKKSLRKHYWPLYGTKTEAGDIGRRLTDHTKDHAYYNTKPALSPDGEMIAFFSDRGGLVDIYLMRTIDGQIIRKLVSGQRSNRFESLHFFTSSLSFSPDGRMIAFVAKSKGKDALFLIDVNSGRIVKKIAVAADALAAPDWSPMGDLICLSANYAGQTDLVLVDVEKGTSRRLTHDAADQLTPRFFPDGRRIGFANYPDPTVRVPSTLSGEARRELSEMDFLSSDNVRHDLDFDIYQIDLETGEVKPVVRTPGNDQSPVVLSDGKTMIFTSDASGIQNLYAANLETGEYHRMTDVLGGLFTPDVVESKNRITFSAFLRGGWDIFVSDNLDMLLDRKYGVGMLASVETEAGTDPGFSSGKAGLGPDIPIGSLISKFPTSAESDSAAEATASSTPTVADSVKGSPVKGEISAAASSITQFEPKPLPRKPVETADAGVEGVTKPVSQEEPATKGATITDYKVRLEPDYIGQGAGLYFSTGFGFGLANTIALSDLLGNHRLLLSFNLFRDIADSDLLATYFYLKRRIDFGFGVFQFKNFLNSRVTSIGEAFQDYRLFTERNYGVFGLVSIPFSTFYRMDLDFQAFISERHFFDDFIEDPLTGGLIPIPSSRSTRRLVEPSLSFVHDASFFSYFGPVEGSRWVISLSKGIGLGESAVSRSTGFLDYRRYKKLFYRNSIALRLVAAASEGEDPRSFFLGGPTTLRGYEYLAFEGSRIALLSVEYRYPLIDALVLGWPTRWGFRNVGGTVFFDVGAAWDKGDITPLRKDVSGLQFQDLHGDFGIGTYFYLGYFLLNLQFSWQTDLRSIGDNQFHFFLGPTF